MEGNPIPNADDFASTLEGFMQDMFDWEMNYYGRWINASCDATGPELESEMREDLLKIFNRYVVKAGRNYDRLENLVCGKIPEYDHVHDKLEVIHIGADKVLVVIEKLRGLKSTYRLTFSKRNGAFMLSKRDFQDERKWCRTYV